MKCLRLIPRWLLLVTYLTAVVVSADDGSCKAAPTTPKDLGKDAPLLAITACTGEAGSRVLKALLEVYPGKRIRCLVRKGTEKPMEFKKAIESVRHVDFMDVSSISKALKGAAGVYLNTPPSLDVKAMRENMAEACVAQKDTVKHIVLLGEAIDIAWYGLAQYWDDHKAGEDAIQKTGIPLTTLHPAFFMEGFGTHFGNPQTITEGDFFSRVGTEPVAYTSLDDVGVVTTKIFIEGPAIHGWKKYNLINDVLTGHEVAEALTKALERKIEYRPITAEDFQDGLVAGGVPEVVVEGYTKAVNMTGQGYFSNDDRGQLEALLGRKPLSMVEVGLNLKSKLSKDNKLERATNK